VNGTQNTYDAVTAWWCKPVAPSNPRQFGSVRASSGQFGSARCSFVSIRVRSRSNALSSSHERDGSKRATSWLDNTPRMLFREMWPRCSTQPYTARRTDDDW